MTPPDVTPEPLKLKRPARVVSLQEVRSARVAVMVTTGSLRDAWTIYQEEGYARTKAPSTRSDLAKLFARLLSPESGMPEAPSRAEAQVWFDRLARDKSPGTANKALGLVKAVTNKAANHCVTGELVRLRNVFAQIEKHPTETPRRRDASPSDVVAILRAAEDDTTRLAMRLMAIYGLRVGEVIALRTTDVRADYDCVRLFVERTRDAYGERGRKNGRAKKGYQHVAIVWRAGDARHNDTETRDLLIAQCEYDKRAADCDSRQLHLAEHFLIPWGVNYADRLIRKWKAQGIVTSLPRGTSAHGLRHFGATAKAGEGGSEADVQRWLGDRTRGAALCYQGQVRGTTESGAGDILAVLHRAAQQGGQGPPTGPEVGMAGAGTPTIPSMSEEFSSSTKFNVNSQTKKEENDVKPSI